MTPEAKGNDEFAKWLEQWIAGIQQGREQIPREKGQRGQAKDSASETQELRITSKALAA